MSVIQAPVGVWTEIIPAGGDPLREARGIGLYVDTTGLNPSNPAEGYALASNQSMVIKEGVPIFIQPAQPVRAVTAAYNPV